MEYQFIKEKKHRLHPELYVGGAFVSFTICVDERKRLFNNKSVISEFESILLSQIDKSNCACWVYVFMPDHLHLIISGKSGIADTRKCISIYKQRTGYWLSKNKINMRWQKDYYDHILRNNEDLIRCVKYILNNPVRAGLVSSWKQYKFFGSTEYSFDSWC